MKINLYWVVVVLVVLIVAGQSGCDDRQQKIAEAQAKLARACTPEIGEEVILRWTMGAEGHYVLYKTIRQPLGRKGNISQFVIVSEDELQ
jgi:hypothetical protein